MWPGKSVSGWCGAQLDREDLITTQSNDIVDNGPPRDESIDSDWGLQTGPFDADGKPANDYARYGYKKYRYQAQKQPKPRSGKPNQEPPPQPDRLPGYDTTASRQRLCGQCRTASTTKDETVTEFPNGDADPYLSTDQSKQTEILASSSATVEKNSVTTTISASTTETAIPSPETSQRANSTLSESSSYHSSSPLQQASPTNATHAHTPHKMHDGDSIVSASPQPEKTANAEKKHVSYGDTPNEPQSKPPAIQLAPPPAPEEHSKESSSSEESQMVSTQAQPQPAKVTPSSPPTSPGSTPSRPASPPSHPPPGTQSTLNPSPAVSVTPTETQMAAQIHVASKLSGEDKKKCERIDFLFHQAVHLQVTEFMNEAHTCYLEMVDELISLLKANKIRVRVRVHENRRSPTYQLLLAQDPVASGGKTSVESPQPSKSVQQRHMTRHRRGVSGTSGDMSKSIAAPKKQGSKLASGGNAIKVVDPYTGRLTEVYAESALLCPEKNKRTVAMSALVVTEATAHLGIHRTRLIAREFDLFECPCLIYRCHQHGSKEYEKDAKPNRRPSTAGPPVGRQTGKSGNRSDIRLPSSSHSHQHGPHHGHKLGGGSSSRISFPEDHLNQFHYCAMDKAAASKGYQTHSDKPHYKWAKSVHTLTNSTVNLTTPIILETHLTVDGVAYEMPPDYTDLVLRRWDDDWYYDGSSTPGGTVVASGKAIEGGSESDWTLEMWVVSFTCMLVNNPHIHRLRWQYEQMAVCLKDLSSTVSDSSWTKVTGPSYEMWYKLTADNVVVCALEGLLACPLFNSLALIRESDLHKQWIPLLKVS
eukprot:GHVN01096706.1.p1 GENE.GHVN01096706.1~~GHVN01096706.1.p1  ORF type:complete len:817 (+),score=150.96 GHVN01096706.1:246-2696(+)